MEHIKGVLGDVMADIERRMNEVGQPDLEPTHFNCCHAPKELGHMYGCPNSEENKPALRLVERTSPRPCKAKPCKSCPFLRSSWPGYLGEYANVGDFYEQHVRGEGLNPCHESINYDDEDWREQFAAGKQGFKCRGQAEFFANMLKSPRNVEIQSVEQNHQVFKWPHEFLAHHGEEK